MKSNSQLRSDVLEELEWEPSVVASEIGVSVDNGVVSLSGRVPTYAEKVAAEDAALRVAQVKAVANEIEVKPFGSGERTDADIARAATEALKWRASVPADRIKVAVSKGWVTLEGQVDWQYQRQCAQDAVRILLGVRGVLNEIVVKPTTSPTDLRSRIESAFRRSAELDAEKIRIEARGGKVTLRGDVRSWSERQEAERTAWAAPGVTAVENHIEVTPYVTAY